MGLEGYLRADPVLPSEACPAHGYVPVGAELEGHKDAIVEAKLAVRTKAKRAVLWLMLFGLVAGAFFGFVTAMEVSSLIDDTAALFEMPGISATSSQA